VLSVLCQADSIIKIILAITKTKIFSHFGFITLYYDMNDMYIVYFAHYFSIMEWSLTMLKL